MKSFGFRSFGSAQDMVSGFEGTNRAGYRRKMVGKIQNSKLKIQNCLGAALLLGAVLAAGCGYQFSGKGEGFPRDVRTVFVEPFINRTKEVGIERQFLAILKSELHQKGQMKLVDSPEEADAVLSGVLRTFDSRVVGVNRHDEALQYEMLLVLDMTLRRRAPDEVLWRTQGARFSDVYAGSRGAVVTTSSDFRARGWSATDVRQFTDIQLTESLRQDARDSLLGQAARDLHARLMEMF